MDLSALKTADQRFWRLSRLAVAVCFAAAGGIMMWAMSGPAVAEAGLLLESLHVY